MSAVMGAIVATSSGKTRQLIRQRPGLKVIYMSGYTEEAVLERGGLDPEIAFLHKPFTSATLVEKLREILDR